MGSGKRLGLLAAAAAALMLAVTSLAWACTGRSEIAISGGHHGGPRQSFTGGSTAAGPAYGPAGSRIVVQGKQFGEGPVELRWNNVAGRYLGGGTGPSFSTIVTIPEDAPQGVHYVVGVQYKADSTTINGQSSAAFEVVATHDPETQVRTSGNDGTAGNRTATASGADREAAGTGRNRTTTAGADDDPGAGTNSATASGAEDGTRRERAGSATQPAGALTHATASGRDGAETRSAETATDSPAGSGTGDKGNVGAPSPGMPASSNPAAVLDSGRRVFGSSLPTTGRRAAQDSAESLNGSGPALASVSEDLFSGFARADTALTPALTDAGAVPGPSSPAAGILLLAAGAATLLGLAAVASVRRRRVAAVRPPTT